MNEFFLKIVHMSITASWLILVVVGLRLVLQKAPKRINVLLWGIVAVRLTFPISIESTLSLIPSTQMITEAVLSEPSLGMQTGMAPADEGVNNDLGAAMPSNDALNVMTVLRVVWLVGMLLLLAYTIICYWRLRRRVDTAVLLRENIFQSESINTPFVLGIIKPRIYIPFKMDERNLEYVLAHEMAHIRRGDHWWKPLGFLLLMVHWFNPLVWLAYVLLCRDIELACDEKVIRELDNEYRADYTQALVACSTKCHAIAACPLAFGEVGVKDRVKAIMNYKKPGLLVNILAVVSCFAVAVCFLTDSVKATETLVPDTSCLETQPEEETKPILDTGDTDSGRLEEAERLDILEAEVDALKEELARLMADCEDMIEAERNK